MKVKSGKSAKILTAAISALMLISLISVFQAGAASAGEPIKIDGVIDEGEWDGATSYALVPSDPNCPRSYTAYVTSDDEFLYVAFDYDIAIGSDFLSVGVYKEGAFEPETINAPGVCAYTGVVPEIHAFWDMVLDPDGNGVFWEVDEDYSRIEPAEDYSPSLEWAVSTATEMAVPLADLGIAPSDTIKLSLGINEHLYGRWEEKNPCWHGYPEGATPIDPLGTFADYSARVKNENTGFYYQTIQAAIDAAESGDTVLVGPGTYNETIDVTKNNLTIQSASDDPSNTIIDANGADSPVVTIANCSGVTLSGFTITGAQEPPGGGSRGIQMLRATGCTISNIVVTETGPLTAGRECAAIYLEGSSSNSFDSVTVSEISGGQVTGILLTGSNSNNFASTTISGITASESGTPEAKGIWVTGGKNNEFVDTEVTRIISDSRACGIYADGNGNTFTSTEVSGIRGRTRCAGIQIRHTTGVEFSDYRISDLEVEVYDSWGIRIFDGVTDCTFSGGSITGADIGFFVESKGDPCTGNSIHRTNIVGNTIGIKNTRPSTIDATLNWWGDPSGPSPVGSGDAVSANVNYTPWFATENPSEDVKNVEVIRAEETVAWSETIQAAIDAAEPGDTIKVAAGTYNETVTIGESLAGLTLLGAQAGVDPTVEGARIDETEESVINGSGSYGAIELSANGIVVDGFTVANIGTSGCQGSGVWAELGVSGGTIQNNILSSAVEHGLKLPYELGSYTVSNNLIKDCGRHGIEWTCAEGSTISGNKITGCTEYGICLRNGALGVTVSGNTITANGGGIHLDGVVQGTIINYNNIYGNAGYGILNESGTLVDATLNWWGHSSGPSEVGSGDGDAVSANVDYNPWLLKSKDEPQTHYDHTLALHDGWNLISTPKILESENINELIVGNKVEFFTYDNNDWIATNSIEPLDAVYVKMDGSGGIGLKWTTDDRVAPPTKQLEESWNLVGPSVNLPSENSVPVDEALDSVNGSWSTVYSPALNQKAWTVTTGNAATENMLPYDGYWIYMTAADELAGRTT